MVEKLIRCTQCNKVIPRYDRFGDFGESSTLPGVEWASDDLDGQKEFLELHRGHVLEELLVDPEATVSDRPAFEPCRVTYMEAGNGKERFLIKRVKEGYDRPAFYELIPGQIRVADISLEIREEELRREIERLNGSFPLPPEKVGKFIEAFREEVRGISLERWREEMERTLPGENSPVTDARLHASLWENALRRCENDLKDSEPELIERFIRNHRKPKNILDLRIRKKISISTPLPKPPA
jgi:hypothetical protein